MKAVLLSIITLLLSIAGYSQDKFSYLDSTQTAVQNGIMYSSRILHENINIENVDALPNNLSQITFKVEKKDQSNYSWIKCVFKNNKCISTEYLNPISSINGLFYFLAEDFNFSSDAKKIVHKTLDIKGEILYDFKQQYFSIKYTRKNQN